VTLPAAATPQRGLDQVLILGGTAEARDLARLAVGAGLPVVSSLAGRVSNPALPVGPVRIGGFGGPVGLADFLAEHRICSVVDATHPFAATISSSAVTACRSVGVPLLRLARPGWSGRPDAPGWAWVDSVAAAGGRARTLGRRAFLTTGRQTVAEYAPMADRYALVRMVEPPAAPLSPAWELILDRGPYTVPGELDLMRSRRIDVLVTKDSGGAYTSAKLDAAAALGVPVVIVRRPAVDGVDSVDAAEAALSWLAALPTR
jgi:precorrin-6A/cobalt-precorrin-6A reductase